MLDPRSALIDVDPAFSHAQCLSQPERWVILQDGVIHAQIMCEG